MLLLYLNKISYLYSYEIPSILSETAFLTRKELGQIAVTFPVLQMEKLRVREEILQLAEVSPPYSKCIVCLIRLLYNIVNVF